MPFQPGAFQADAFQFLYAGAGPAGVATLVIDVESGATITSTWQTDIMEAIDGTEQRASMLARPRQRYEFSTLLTDAKARAMLSLLSRRGAEAPVFLLGLAHDDATIVSSTSGSVTVHSLAYLDWAAATCSGQRVIVVSPAGDARDAVVQFATGTTIGIDVDLTAFAVEGARIMPAVPIFLESEQGFTRYKVGLTRWDLTARAILPEYASGTVGAGATVATFDSLPIWDRGVARREAAQPLMTGAEMADLGGALSQLSSYTAAAWGRALRSTSHRASEWAWLKKFCDTVQGRRAAFLLPTGRPDLVPIGDASSGTLTVEGPPVANAPDYVNDWHPSLAHRRLRILLADGTAAYRTVTAVAASMGSQDLALNASVAGAIERVEFLETVRLESDSMAAKWNGRVFETEMSARVVQG